MVRILVLSAFLILSAITAPVFAGGELDSKALRELLTGNSVKSTDVPKGWWSTIYFAPDGQLHSEDQNGNREKGTWKVDPKNAVCLERRKSKCWKLQPAAEEGVYNVYSKKSGRHKKDWRVLEGNPKDL
jgi:hypothetical protein